MSRQLALLRLPLEAEAHVVKLGVVLRLGLREAGRRGAMPLLALLLGFGYCGGRGGLRGEGPSR